MNEIKVKWPLVIEEWDKPYLNWIDLANTTMYRMAAFKTAYPRCGLFVGIEKKGAFFFTATMKPFVHCEYVGEKLNLAKSDACAIADWINAQIEVEAPQQRSYHKHYILEIGSYGLIGEMQQMPWSAEIIEDNK
jgi:hypothetical protein